MVKYTVENATSVLFVSSDLTEALVRGLILSKGGEEITVNRIAEVNGDFRTTCVRMYR